MPSPSKTPDLVSGVVKTLTFVNPETGYFVARIDVEGGGERTVVGNTPLINVGELLSAEGTWSSSKWGTQFKANRVTLSAPTLASGIEKYLANAVEGIGKGYAKKLVSAFGEAVFDVIEKTPEKLFSVPGVGKKRAASILEAIEKKKESRECMLFLHNCGLPPSKAQKVYKQFGGGTIEKLKENPYILCGSIWGVGFATADKVAKNLGVKVASSFRVTAGVHHVLNEAQGRGSCGLPVERVLEQAQLLLNVSLDVIEEVIGDEVAAGNLIKDKADGIDCLFPPGLYVAEERIARRLYELSSAPVARPIADIDQCVTDAEVELGIVLDDTQREAVKVALRYNVVVLTGGPGTGKTTITRVLLKVFEDNGVKHILLTAPTGKAAKRASEATGRLGSTIHRALEPGRDGKFKFNASNRLTCDNFHIDEGTMVDVRLMGAVCAALPDQTRFVLVGDVDQLPSVGPGKVLADIIASETIPTVRLKTIFRQAATSDIVKNAHAINEGRLPKMGWTEGSDFCFINISPKKKDDEDEKNACRLKIEYELLRIVRDLYKRGFDPVKDVQVLAPMRKGLLGVESLNLKLQALLNPHPVSVLEAAGTRWCVGDKVMQLRNNYDKNVFNGEVGFIVEADPVRKIVTVQFDDRFIEYAVSDLDELSLAYAYTIHRSQGSEFPVVVMPLDWSHFTMLKRGVFYTAVTRAKQLCIVLGQAAAANVAVQNAQSEERYTQLKERLREAFALAP